MSRGSDNGSDSKGFPGKWADIIEDSLPTHLPDTVKKISWPDGSKTYVFQRLLTSVVRPQGILELFGGQVFLEEYGFNVYINPFLILLSRPVILAPPAYLFFHWPKVGLHVPFLESQWEHWDEIIEKLAEASRTLHE